MPARGRKPKPHLVGIATGANKANPARYKGEEPRSDVPIGEPPAYLNKWAKQAWKEIVDRSVPGVLTETDEHVVEMTALLIGEMRMDWTEFSAAKMNNLRQNLASLGMTPADRRRLANSPDKNKGNPFDDF